MLRFARPGALLAGLALAILLGCSATPPPGEISGEGNAGGGNGPAPAGAIITPGPAHSGTLRAASLSVTHKPATANSGASRAVVSADGRWIVLTSASSDLIELFQDLGAKQPPYLFLHDRQNGKSVLIDHNFTANNEASNAMSDFADISADGRFVVFEGHASNLVPGFPREGGRPQVYRYDRETNNNSLLSFSSIIKDNDPRVDRHTHLPTPGSAQSPRISDDGRFTVYLCSGKTIAANQTDERLGSNDVFLYDANKDLNVLVSHVPSNSATTGNGQGCELPNISGDGRYVVFLSDSTNLIEGTDANGIAADLFVYDRTMKHLTLVSHAHDSKTTTCDGGVTNTTRPQISDDGRFIVYGSSAKNLVSGLDESDSYLYLYDQQTGENKLVNHPPGRPASGGNGISEAPVLSGNGRWIAFESEATKLVTGMDVSDGGRHVYLYDRVQDATHLVSHAPKSTLQGGSGNAFYPSISRDGRYVAFYSDAPNHVAGQQDDPQGFDVFLYDHQTRGITLVSHARDASARSGGEGSDLGQIAADRPVVVFLSHSPDLVASDSNKSLDVFWFEWDE